MHKTIVSNVVIEQAVVLTGLFCTFASENDRKGLLEIMKDDVIFDLGSFFQF